MFPWACPKFPSGSESKKLPKNEHTIKSDNGLAVRSYRSTSTGVGSKAHGDDSPARFSHHRGQSHIPLALCPSYPRSKTRSLERSSDVKGEKSQSATVEISDVGKQPTRRKPQKLRPPSSNRHSVVSSSGSPRLFTAEPDAVDSYNAQGGHAHTDAVNPRGSSKNQSRKYSVLATGYPPFPDPSITPLIEGLPCDFDGQHSGSRKPITSHTSKGGSHVDQAETSVSRGHDKRSRSSGAMNELHMRRNKKSTNATKIDMGRSVDQEHREGRETGRTLTKSNAPFVSSREDRKKEASHCPQRHSLSMTSTKQPKAENTEHFDEKLMDQIEDINSTGCYFLNENDTGYDTPTGKVWSPTKRPGRKKKRFRKNYQGAAMNLTTRHSVGSFANLQQQFTNLPKLIDQLSPFEDVFLEAEITSLPNSMVIPESAATEEPFGFSGNNQIVLSFEELALNENTNCFLRHSKSYCSATTEQQCANVKTQPEANSDHLYNSQNVHTFPLKLQSIIKELPPFLAMPTSVKEQLPCRPLKQQQANNSFRNHSDVDCCSISAIMQSNGPEHNMYNTATSANTSTTTAGTTTAAGEYFQEPVAFIGPLRRNKSCMSEPDHNGGYGYSNGYGSCNNTDRSGRLFSATEDENFSNMELVKAPVACSDSDVSKTLSSNENALSLLSASTSAIKASIFGSQKLEETLKSVSEMSLKPRIRLSGVVHSRPSSYSNQRQFSPLIVNRILASANALKIDDSVIGLSRSKSDGAGCANKLMVAASKDMSPNRDFFQRSSVSGILESLDKVWLSSKEALVSNGAEQIVAAKRGGNTSFLLSAGSAASPTTNCFSTAIASCGTTPVHPRVGLITKRSTEELGKKTNLSTKPNTAAGAAAAAVNDNFCSAVKSEAVVPAATAAAVSTTTATVEHSCFFIINQDTRTKLSEQSTLPSGHKKPDKVIRAQTDFTPTLFARDNTSKSFKQRHLSIPTLRKANVAPNFAFIPADVQKTSSQVDHKPMENSITIPMGVADSPLEHSTETPEGHSNELNQEIQLSTSNDESSPMSASFAVNKKKEIAVKPQPPASLIKPLDILEFSSHSVSETTIPEPHDLNNSVSMPVLPGNISQESSHCVNSMKSSNSMENSNARRKVPNGFQHKSANNLPVKEQYDSPVFLQPNPDIRFSVAFSEEHLHVPVDVSCLQKSSENITTNTSRCDSVSNIELDNQHLDTSEMMFRGMERSTTFPITINELLDAETRVTEN